MTWVDDLYAEVRTWPMPAPTGPPVPILGGLTRRWFTLAPPVDLVPLNQSCGATWAPRTCRSLATAPAARLRSPIDHECGLSRAFPHVCRCVRCGHSKP